MLRFLGKRKRSTSFAHLVRCSAPSHPEVDIRHICNIDVASPPPCKIRPSAHIESTEPMFSPIPLRPSNEDIFLERYNKLLKWARQIVGGDCEVAEDQLK